MGNCFKRSSTDDSALLRNDSHDTSGSNEQPVNVESVAVQVVAASEPQAPQQQNIMPVRQPHRHAADNLHFLTEEEQIRHVKRITLIQHLPTGIYDEEKKVRECVICMCDFELGQVVRFLPCMHIYHRDCIDGWLIKSFTCPSCMEPVESALLATYQTN